MQQAKLKMVIKTPRCCVPEKKRIFEMQHIEQRDKIAKA
ncbi:hypothetical protein AC26_1265 [Escherichia coli 1-176-05_S3_C2]|nr:hypothetical protein AC26_1265 [Escherichia coli 1-176-05_S3_C2]